MWTPTSTEPALVHLHVPSEADTQWNHTSVMYVRDRLRGRAIDDWYLWRWTHDTSKTYLYTAPAVTGPYTLRGFGEAPTPYPEGYVVNHFSAGDIVWDPDGRQFIASPHGVRDTTADGSYGPAQDSFLTCSRDGLTWSWLDRDNRPRLRCGPPGSPDSIHTGYGRLLRDLDVNLAQHAGRNWWVYRAQRLDDDGAAFREPPVNLRHVGTSYTAYLASAPSIRDDFDQKQKAWDSHTANTGLNSFGCFVRAGGRHHVYAAEAFPDPPIVPVKSTYHSTGGDDMGFSPVPLVPLSMVSPRGPLIEDNTIVRDPTSGVVYNIHTQAVVNADAEINVEVWVYRGGPV